MEAHFRADQEIKGSAVSSLSKVLAEDYNFRSTNTRECIISSLTTYSFARMEIQQPTYLTRLRH
jgi:hypothetical protein